MSANVPVLSSHTISRFGTNFCLSVSCDPLVARLTFLQSQAVADSTCRSYQTGICRHSHFCASSRWQVFQPQRLHYTSSQPMTTMTVTLLRQIKEELACDPDYLPIDKLMLWSAFALVFSCFLWSSEFPSPSASQFNPLARLYTTDVSLTSTGCLTLCLKVSKTDPY